MADADDGWLLSNSGDVDDVARYYDEWADRYDADLRGWSYVAPDTAVSKLLGHGHDPDRVLDAGCGTGLVGEAFGRSGFTGSLMGVDVSAESLRVAELTGAYETTAIADLQRPLGFVDDEFDALICVGVMTYVPEVEQCWREFARVVRPGGIIVVTQRGDLWDERGCSAVIDRMVADGAWHTIEITAAEPYLPGNDDWPDRIGVRYVVAEVV